MMDAMRVVVSQFDGIDVTPVLPLAAGCLVATARADPALAGAEFAITLERKAIADAVAEYRRPDVVGLSLYPWNAAYTLAVAEAARAAHPEALIVAGGPAVPRRPERARRFLDENPTLDVLVFAEGELTFRELLRARAAGRGFADIPGIAVRASDGPHLLTAPPGRVHDFSATVSPYLDGTFDELYQRYRDHVAMALCETNRGCPFSCTFCDWSLTKHVVEFPLERVHAELDWIARRGFRHVMMADANFGIRRRDTDIARYLAELRQTTGSPSSFYFYLTKNDHARNLETIDILQAADIGCWIGLAVQDFDDHVLEAVKRDNIQTGEAMALRRICAERGIATFNELILGLPGQTYDSFTATVAEAMPALPRHDFVLFLCRLIDNTELGDPASRAEHGIETRLCQWKTSTPDWNPIVDEYQEVVVATRDMPLEAWKRTYRFSFLAAALYNLRLLRVPLAVRAGGDLRGDLERLADLTDAAAPGTVFGAIGAIVDRYLASILGGGPFVLPLDGADAPLYVDEAIARCALARYPGFLDEVAAALDPRDDVLAEALRYQALVTPHWGHTEDRAGTFGHDWPAFAGGAPLVARATTARFTPPAYAAVASFEAFATTHLACIRARLDTGAVAADAQADPRRRRNLVVLPTSG